MNPITIGAVALFAACGDVGAKPQRPALANELLFKEQFSEVSFSPEWTVTTPAEAGAAVQLQDGAITLSLLPGSDGDIGVRHKLEMSRARGRRVRLTARARTEAPSLSYARITMKTDTDHGLPSYRDFGSTGALNDKSWRVISAVFDIGMDVRYVELQLVLHGPGSAWFDDIELTNIRSSPAIEGLELSGLQVANLATATRAAALIRYAHPSDESAGLDWNEFLPVLLDQVYRNSFRAISTDDLRFLFRAIAPTVEFTKIGRGATIGPSPVNGKHLVRWRRYGLGAPPFAAFREGSDPDIAFASSSLRIGLERFRGCTSVSVRAKGHKLPGPGDAVLFVQLLRPGTNVDDLSESFNDGSAMVSLITHPPSDTFAMEIGIRITGIAGIMLTALSIECDKGKTTNLDIESEHWTRDGADNLYTWKTEACNSPTRCVTFYRNPLDTQVLLERDVLSADVGSGLAIHVPIAVWSNGSRTLPIPPDDLAVNRADFAYCDLPARLATIAAAWGTLSLFYPYFEDLQIDWTSVLPGALAEVAGARSGDEVHTSLAHLLTHLRDNHARIVHPATPANGVLPIALRRFGNVIVVSGGLPEYLKVLPVGSELLKLDGVDAVKAYDHAAAETSAATEGLLAYLAPLRMGTGTPGTFHRLQIRSSDGHTSEQILPLVAFEVYSHTNRERHPASGSQLAADTYYIDLDSISTSTWSKLLPELQHAKVILLDFRGYVTDAAFEMISHVIVHEVSSPIWGIPQIPSTHGVELTHSHWNVRVQAPRLSAKLVALIDGRSMSAVETILQMFHENKLGLLVGETSGGTNGNVTSVRIPGGFEFRFTAMRAGDEHGGTVHGHGFKPDVVVHPTLDGVRAGRDEILEAALSAAQRLAHP